MKKLRAPRHKWIKQPEFRSDKCEHCGAIRYWDAEFNSIMYRRGDNSGPYYFTPSCKFVMATDVSIKM
jgi:hypothetical protein